MSTQHTPMIEYRDMTAENRSHVTVLDRAVHNGNEYSLTHHTAGYECAGSAARWTNERWRVRFARQGATFGQAFMTETEARAEFKRRTCR